ncbi:unnamed protein product, partial [Iphiclides podalirius]
MVCRTKSSDMELGVFLMSTKKRSNCAADTACAHAPRVRERASEIERDAQPSPGTVQKRSREDYRSQSSKDDLVRVLCCQR